MRESDWVLTAAISSLGYEPTQSFADAVAVAKDLYQVWPSMDPHDAVRCYFEPEANVLESIVFA